MANEIVIDTELNAEPVTRSMEEIQRDIDKTIQAQEKLQDRFDKFEFSGGKEGSRTFKNMRFDAEKLNDKLILLNEELERAKAAEGMEENAAKIETVKTASDRAAKSVRKLGDSAKQSGKSFSAGVKSMLKYAIGVRSLFALINKLRSGIKEGLKNLVQIDGGQNSLNGAISSLMSSLTMLKNSFGSAFAPIITTIMPLLTLMIDKLSEAATTVGKFFAALSGSGTFTQAVKVQEDYAKSLSDTAKNAKKAKGQLAGFYDLNVINTKDNNQTTAADPNKMFETVQIESKITGFADRVRAILDPIKESIAGWVLNIDVNPMIESLGKLKASAEPFIESVGEGFTYILENVLEPLGSFAIEDAFPTSIETVAAAFEALKNVLEPIKPAVDDLFKNTFTPFGQWLGKEFLGNLSAVRGGFSELAQIFKDKSKTISQIFTAISATLSLFVMNFKLKFGFASGAFREFVSAVVNFVGHLIDTLGGLITFIQGVFTLDWEKAWSGIKDIFRGIINMIIDIFEGAINMIVGGLNNIAIDIPDFVPGVGGKHIGFNIPKVNWPRLATGTVIPRQAKEFGAILGDNNRETEVVSPLSTIKKAVKEVMDESRDGKNVNIKVVLEGDAKGVFRLVKTEAEDYLDTYGEPAF